MVRTTKEQRQSLKVLWSRNTFSMSGLPKESYRELRKPVYPDFAYPGNVVVPWCGMHVLILKDGSRHT